jgi:hypothetical protein
MPTNQALSSKLYKLPKAGALGGFHAYFLATLGITDGLYINLFCFSTSEGR